MLYLISFLINYFLILNLLLFLIVIITIRFRQLVSLCLFIMVSFILFVQVFIVIWQLLEVFYFWMPSFISILSICEFIAIMTFDSVNLIHMSLII